MRSSPEACRPVIANGVTLVELVLAITVTAALSSLVFGSYVGLYKGFTTQIGRGEGVLELVAAKSLIDAELREVVALKTVRQSAVEIYTSGDSLVHIVEFKGGEVLSDGRAVVKGLSAFTVTALSDEAGPAAVFWEAETRSGGWLGGAVRFQGQ